MRPPARRGIAAAVTLAAMTPAALAAMPTAALAAGPAADATRPQAASTRSLDGFDARVAALLPSRIAANKALGSVVGVQVVDLASGRVVYSRGAATPLRVASVTKLATATAVLTTAGPARRMRTGVRVDPGTLRTTVRGGGDPLLSWSDVDRLAAVTATRLAPALAAAKKAGRTVVPTVQVDTTLFPAPVSAMGWTSTYVPTEVHPVTPLALVGSTSRTPALDVGRLFVARLATRGVVTRLSAAPGVAAPDASLVAVTSGHTVEQAVRQMLLWSDNNTAETLFRQAALAAGRPASWAASRQTVREVLARYGVPLTGVTVVDGSGLSLTGRFTPQAVTAILALEGPARPALQLVRTQAMLPLAGRTGTLSRANQRFVKAPATCAVGRLTGKTGTVADAIALAGHTLVAGQEYAYSIVVNRRPTSYTRQQTRWAVDNVAATLTGCY